MADPDQLTKERTIYDVGAGEIIWRNFLAGMSRAIGGMVIYLVILIILGNVFVTYMWPYIEPIFAQLGETTAILKQVNSLTHPGSVNY